MKDHITVREKYEPAMRIERQAEADAYFEELVEHTMCTAGVSRERAELIERTNLGWFAAEYGSETRSRVERLFRCVHPFFGSVADSGPATPEQAFELGRQFAKKMQQRSTDL